MIIVGSTAVGKTELSIQLAERLNAEIISADSRLFYRGMDIGTAKPTEEERSRVPHHLIDIANPDQTVSLPFFQKAAHVAIIDITKRGRLPILVGGTGQYVRAVLEGWNGPAVPPHLPLRHALEVWVTEITPIGLHQRLKSIDPIAAKSIDPLNVRRTVRALEVIFTTGKLFSQQRQRSEPPYTSLTVGLIRPRLELYQRIDLRIESMLQAGLVKEVRGLLAQGYSSDLPSMSAIGYREIIQYLQGKITLDEAIILIKRQTRVFVRRQSNWFKEKDSKIYWLQVEPDIVKKMQNLVKNWINSEDLRT